MQQATSKINVQSAPFKKNAIEGMDLEPIMKACSGW